MSILKIAEDRVISTDKLKKAISLKCANCYGAMSMCNALGGMATDEWILCHAYIRLQLRNQ